MTGGVLSNPKRWRAFADAVALALGINVWISIVVLPGFFVGSFRETADILAASIPLFVLGGGLTRRSEAVLLLLFPAALMVPVVLSPEIVSGHVYGPIRFVIVAVGLVAYLIGVSFFTSFYEPPPPKSMRPLASSRRPMPVRWKRRFRIYRAMAVLSVIFPITLLYTVNFDSASEGFIRQMFPGRVGQMTTVLNVAVIAGWLLIYGIYFLGVLKVHRTGDRELVGELNHLRAEAKHGKPRSLFYVAVVCSLGFMLLLLLDRYS